VYHHVYSGIDCEGYIALFNTQCREYKYIVETQAQEVLTILIGDGYVWVITSELVSNSRYCIIVLIYN